MKDYFRSAQTYLLLIILFAGNEGGSNGAIVFGSDIAQLVGWISSTVLGFVLGAAITQPEKRGLEFVVTSEFYAFRRHHFYC